MPPALTVSMDTNYDPSETWNGGVHEALDHVDVFLPNATEAMAITGTKLTDGGDRPARRNRLRSSP